MRTTDLARQGEALPAMIPDFNALRMQAALREAYLASRAGRDIQPAASHERTIEIGE